MQPPERLGEAGDIEDRGSKAHSLYTAVLLAMPLYWPCNLRDVPLTLS